MHLRLLLLLLLLLSSPALLFFFFKAASRDRFAAADLFLFRGSYLDGSPGTSGPTSVRFCRSLSRHISSRWRTVRREDNGALHALFRRVHSRILRVGRDNARVRSYRPGRIVWYFYVRAPVYRGRRRRCREI